LFDSIKKIKSVCLLIISISLSFYASTALASSWSGVYLGFAPSMTITDITNSADTDHGFTNAAVGLNIGKLIDINKDLLIGGEVNLNTGPFTQYKFHNSGDPAKGNFSMENRNTFFGSLLASIGTSLNQHIAIFVNGGAGFLTTKTIGTLVKNGVTSVSHHNDNKGFIHPVIGGTILYKTDSNFYSKLIYRYYVPVSGQYYSTVGLGNATLRKGVMQAGIEIGKKWG